MTASFKLRIDLSANTLISILVGIVLIYIGAQLYLMDQRSARVKMLDDLKDYDFAQEQYRAETGHFALGDNDLPYFRFSGGTVVLENAVRSGQVWAITIGRERSRLICSFSGGPSVQRVENDPWCERRKERTRRATLE